MKKHIFISGASRGIGLEFVRQYIQKGHLVFAGCRNPGNAGDLQALGNEYKFLTIVRLDVTKEEQIAKSVWKVGKKIDKLDLLVNVAGVYDEGQELGNLTFKDGIAAFSVNTLGPLLIAQDFLPLLKKGTNAKVISISTGMGTFSAKTSGGHYFYSASKAALNMCMLALAHDVRDDGIISVLLNPGWVRTDMGGPSAPLTPEKSVAGMKEVINNLTMKDAGQFLRWNGERMEW